MATQEDDDFVYEEVEAPPAVNYFLAKRNEKPFTWKSVLGELIDNSLDAGATDIELRFSRNNFSIIDNGAGIKDIKSVFQLGNHCQHDQEGSGRYGVGFKDSAILLWGTTIVTSSRDGVCNRVEIDWEEQAKKDRWVFNPGSRRTDEPNGTCIEFLRTCRTLTSQQIPSLLKHLQWMFFNRRPGVKIKLFHQKAPYDIGRLRAPSRDESDTIRANVELNGKTADIEIGIVKDGETNDFPGLTYTLAHRSLTYTSQGLGEYSSRNIFGVVKLSQGWAVAKHKDAIVDEDMPLLEERIQEIAGPLLEKAQERAENVESAAFDNQVQNRIAEILGQAVKERRDKGESHGTAEPKETGRTRTPRKTQPSNKITRAMQGRLKYEWKTDPELENGFLSVGHFDKGGPRVYLNELVPFLATARQQKNVDVIALAAISVMAAHAGDAQATFHFKGNSMIQIMSQVLG